MMENPEFINCETKWLPDTEESNTCEPGNMPYKMTDFDRMSLEPDIKDDISRLIKQEPLTEEIWVKNDPDEVGAVKLEEDCTATIEKEISHCESYQSSGMDGDREVKDELDDIRGSLKDDARNSTLVTTEEPSSYFQQSNKEQLHSSLLHKPLKRQKSPGFHKTYVCGCCFKDFRCKRYLNNHMRIHSDEVKYTCAECNRGFKFRDCLIKHLAVHNDLKPYKCSNCSKGFRIKSHLSEHMRTHSDDRPYACRECCLGFKRKRNFMCHMAIHNNVKSFMCNICLKKFRTRKNLSDHLRSHSEERPYNCNECGKGFKFRSSLVDHLKVHSSLKDHKGNVTSVT